MTASPINIFRLHLLRVFLFCCIYIYQGGDSVQPSEAATQSSQDGAVIVGGERAESAEADERRR